MKILTQNKELLIETDSVKYMNNQHLLEEANIKHYLTVDDRTIIGEFDTKEKAMAVLHMIATQNLVEIPKL